MALSLQEAFSSLEDPRIERHKRHQLLDIIILTICAVISGAEGWEAIEAFGRVIFTVIRRVVNQHATRNHSNRKTQSGAS